jgi:predicted hydrocarbon binding protein
MGSDTRTDAPVTKMRRWMTCVHESIGDLGCEQAPATMKRAGEACAADLMLLCEKHIGRKIGSVTDLLESWNELRIERNLGGRWEFEDNIVSAVFSECGCPLVRSGLIAPHPVHCHCSAGMLETIFSQVFKRIIEVEIRRSIGRGDDTCEFLIKA